MKADQAVGRRWRRRRQTGQPAMQAEARSGARHGSGARSLSHVHTRSGGWPRRRTERPAAAEVPIPLHAIASLPIPLPSRRDRRAP